MILPWFTEKHRKSSPWSDLTPIREELFGIDRLEQHAESLAKAQSVTINPISVFPLKNRLSQNSAVLRDTYQTITTDLENGKGIAHAAEWLLDNYHIVETQIREIRTDLPPGYYNQLPKLADGPFAGYPRVFGLAWAFIAHTDSHFDPQTLRQFIRAYQRVQLLTIGELWAVAITLRIVLIENLRRLGDQINEERAARADAELLAKTLLQAGRSRAALDLDIASHSSKPLSDTFIVHLSKHLRDQDQRTMPAITWLEEMTKRQGLSVAGVVQKTQQQEGATNVTVRNVITSMRLISDIDWADWFESVSLVDEHLNHGHDFYAMDFSTRNTYRSAIEQLARGSRYSELEIADLALHLCNASGLPADPAKSVRAEEPGYYLIAEGRNTLEKAIQFKPTVKLSMSRLNLSMGIGGYIAVIALATLSILGMSLYWLGEPDSTPWLIVVFAIAGFIPASEVATTLINRFIGWSVSATTLPGLALKAGIPSSLRTLVAVPILLTDEAELLKHIERLEVHYLSGVGGDLYFALLSDGADADEENVLSDLPLLTLANASIAELNQKYAQDDDLIRSAPRFLFLHRRRLFNPNEGKWIGWERKRGKLHELNRLLRGATDTTFTTLTGETCQVPADVRYVVTLDADTRLPRDAVGKLIGKMAHPLNRAIFNQTEKRVVQGYGILQPRVTPTLPLKYEGSRFQRIFSAPGGIDPYAAASSDLYQDMFDEGSFTGKGIYEIDAFESALKGRVPENTLLSHDLFEGIFARAGLASDIEVVEESPTRYDVSSKRQHRWTRGDWQLLPWVLNYAHERYLSKVGRWKMIDNLRRSLIAPSYLAVIACSWWLPLMAGRKAIAFTLVVFALPTILPILFSLFPHQRDFQLRNHSRNIVKDIWQVLSYHFLSIALLVDQSLRMGDAILRTLVRLFITRKNLLEWTTSAKSKGDPSLTVSGFYKEMAGSVLLASMISAGTLAFNPVSWPLVLPFWMLWICAPFFAFSVSATSVSKSKAVDISDATAESLRLTARKTWRFFERFVTPLDNMLPPDNFQEEPVPVIAHRTSPTNIGLYLLSTVAARDFGWAGTIETLERLESTFSILRQLPKFRGHLFNWYGTLDLKVLDPPYVSSVDSGNLAGHLIALANACDEWIDHLSVGNAKSGMLDHLRLAQMAVLATPISDNEAGKLLLSRLDEIALQLNDDNLMSALPALKRLAEKTALLARSIFPVNDQEHPPEAIYWIDALAKSVNAHQQDELQIQQGPLSITSRLQAIASNARSIAMEMDFAFLIEPERKLLSIGYSLYDNSLDASCYDLLASEARLASLFTIAKGDVSTKHWFRLGRTATPVGNGSALISWSGSMFEYLMPSLVMRAPVGSLLEQTNKLIVEKQRDYAKSHGIPWGISESAYNARDIEFTYQYSNFGIPGLGLKRGLSENLVIAPYATGLATMVDATAAQANFKRIAGMGGAGRYGFYEALDFTPSRLREDQQFTVVRNYMAHHQGMTIVAIANCLNDGEMRNRFHREPMIQSCELLLQERMPRNIAILHPRAEEVNASVDSSDRVPHVRRLTETFSANPHTHLLSNGAYSLMITATGAGYSHWNDMAITRWSADATREEDGCFIFIKDVDSGDIWTAAGQEIHSHTAGIRKGNEIIFSEAHVEFLRHDHHLMTQMDVVVSGEENAEVRRVSVTNNSRLPYELEFTSYAELVLATSASDKAHPAFSKMFVVTEYLAEFGALLATRRLRSANDTQVWAAHFCVAEAEMSAPPQYESDRARFIGREKTVKTARVIMDGQKLSNTAGTVLDPIFSLRNRIVLAPGKVARLAYWTVVASSRQELLDILDKHHERSAFERAHTLAWTLSQVQMRYLDITSEEAANFQQLAAPILYADKRFRAHADVIARGAGPQSALWSHSISGDLPIMVLRIDELEDMPKVHELLRAHQYWRMKNLFVDLVIINERASSYVQDLQNAIETAVRTSRARRREGENLSKGIVFTLRADLMNLETRHLLHSIARIVFMARHGLIAQQLARVANSISTLPPVTGVANEAITSSEQLAIPADLEFFNDFGGFAEDGKEYVTVLSPGKVTPAPWINVISNGQFGFQVSASGSGYTWAENSRENQITPWSNDAVMDAAGEVFYVRDEMNGVISSPTALPIRDQGIYLSRHGFGYSQFQHISNALELSLLQYVPLEDPVKISRLFIRNLSERPRTLSVTAYTELVLGTSRAASAPFIVTEQDSVTKAIFAKNPWSISYANRMTFADMVGKQTHWTADRTAFIGRYGDLANPKALSDHQPLDGSMGAGMDPCAALQRTILLAPGESIEVTSLLGQCQSVEDARVLIDRYRAIDLDLVLDQVKQYWQALLGAIQVKTPDRSMDIMLNGWLLYQTMACRILARSAFYQASGAYGFRDQLQDCMAMSFVAPAISRQHLLKAAGRQFAEGDMQHWWLPQTGSGVRTRISDDCVWLAFCTAHYIECAGDSGVLDESIPFLEGQHLREGEHDCFFQPIEGGEAASLYEHCVRGLERCMQLTGQHGLPLIGTGDWNDGMNHVGKDGRGESVWLGWLLIRTIMTFAPVASARHTDLDDARVKRWYAHAESLRQAIEREAWDGKWYRRATFDDGSWLGSIESEECRIDSIAQSWAALSGVADPVRVEEAMASLEQYLIHKSDGIALLFTPPFDQTHHDPGYIKGYPAGLRENGGQYSHAAMWTVLAFAKLGKGKEAAALFAMLNPITHARDESSAVRYKVEPYVIAADVYSVAPHTGRGGWTWYTGSAGWMYRAGVEGILGIRRAGNHLLVKPCLPENWPAFEAVINIEHTKYSLRIENDGNTRSAISGGTWEGIGILLDDGTLQLPLNGGDHEIVVRC